MCRMCHVEFQTGDDFYLMDDKKLICKADYENAKAKGKTFLELILTKTLTALSKIRIKKLRLC